MIAQLLTESMLLALAGGALGLLVSQWLAKGLLVAMDAPAGLAFELRMEPMVALYALVLSVATGFSFGLAPALGNANQPGAGAARGGVERRRGAAIAENLVGTQRAGDCAAGGIANAAAGCGSGSAARAAQLWQRSRVRRVGLVSASFRLNMQGYNQARTVQFQENLRQRIAGMPGVTSVAMASAMPLANGMGWFPLAVEGRPDAAGPASPHADYNVISPEFFETIGVRMVRGRGFTANDREGSPPVAMVNLDMARRNWPNEEAIGKRIRLSAATGPYFEVVGVAPDMQDASDPYNSVRPTVYVPYAQGALFLKGVRTDPPAYQMRFLARTSGAPAVLKEAIRQEAHATDSSLRVTVETVEESLEARFGPVKTLSMTPSICRISHRAAWSTRSTPIEPKAKSTAERSRAWRKVLPRPRSRLRALKENDAERPSEKRKTGDDEVRDGETRRRRMLEPGGNRCEDRGDVDGHHDEDGQSPQVIQGLPSLTDALRGFYWLGSSITVTVTPPFSGRRELTYIPSLLRYQKSAPQKGASAPAR